MSRRRKPQDRAPMREVVIVCTGQGSHRRVVLERVQIRAGRQRFHNQPKHPDGRYAKVSDVVKPGSGEPAADADDLVKGIRATCRVPGCAIDVVLKSTTITDGMPWREDVWRYSVDVSSGAKLPEQ